MLASPRLVLLVLCAILSLSQAAAPAEVIAFKDVRVFDGRTTIEKATVLVRDGKIAEVGEKVAVPNGARLVEGAGHTLLPGLIDCHTHTFVEEMLKGALLFGVTTELDMFTSHEFAATMRAQQQAGQADGRADLFSAGTLVTAEGGHGTEYGMKIPTIAQPEEAQAFVDARIAEGSDFIKIVYDTGASVGMRFPSINKETMAAVVQAAHARKKLAVVHVLDLQSARESIAAGADALVHIFCDQRIDADFVKLAAEKKAFVIPTLTVIESCGGVASGKALVDDAALKPFIGPPDAQQLCTHFPVKAGCDRAIALDAVGKLHAAGVPILCGTDAPNPGTTHGASIHRELELLVEAGLTPAEALAGATSAPAEMFSLKDRGSIAPGKRADLLLVKGDPTRDIKATRNLAGIWKGGKAVDLEAHKESVSEQREHAAQAKNAPPPAGSESGLVSDFEADALEAKFGAGWMSSTDGYVGGKSTVDFRRAEGGAGGSKGSLLIAGEIEDRAQPRWAGAIFYPGAAPMTPANLSSKRAISFAARGDGKTYSVMLFSKSRGYQPSFKQFKAGDEWKTYRFPVQAFDGCDGSDIMGLFFGGGNDAGKFELRVDDVRFE